MTIRLENTFTVPVDVERAWSALVDIPLVASCVPGASIEGRDPAGAHLGKVGLRLGPVAVEYQGRIEVARRDDAARVLSLCAQGADSRGQGAANAHFTLEVKPHGAETTAHVITEVDVTGRAAQFGRGIMEQVARRLVGQFSTNLGLKLTGHPTVDCTEPGGETAATTARLRRERAASIGLGVAAALGWLMWRRMSARC
jgi:carbon monoxide dehydrogenase subunit G